MNNKEWNLLIEDWNKFLNESLKSSDDKEIKKYSDMLQNVILKFKESVSEDDYDYYRDKTSLIYQKLENTLYKDNINLIGQGLSREGYSLNNSPWVLKIAMNISGAINNKKELDIQINRKHGSGAQEGFVQIYSWDKINSNPWWVISEKVVQLDKIQDLNLLKKIFPTFWNCLEGENNKFKKDSKNFKEFITKTLMSLVHFERRKLKKSKLDLSDYDLHRDYLSFTKLFPEFGEEIKEKVSKIKRTGKLDSIFPNISNQTIYEQMSKLSLVKDFSEVDFGKDIIFFKKILGYITTSDLHEDNIGIVLSNIENASPESIRILDFDVNI
jgi:hypothetical protein